jgi:carboxyl-terminal processing protease
MADCRPFSANRKGAMPLNKKISVGLTISIAALVAAVTFIVTSFFTLQHFNEKVQAVKEKAEKYERLEMVDTYVRDRFYTELDEDALNQGEQMEYVLNTSGRKFHLPDCQSVEDMKEENKQEYTGTRALLVAQGYEPCGTCAP